MAKFQSSLLNLRLFSFWSSTSCYDGLFPSPFQYKDNDLDYFIIHKIRWYLLEWPSLSRILELQLVTIIWTYSQIFLLYCEFGPNFSLQHWQDFFLQKILCNIFQSKNSGNFLCRFFLKPKLMTIYFSWNMFLKNYSSYGLSLWHLYKIPGISGLDSGTIGTIEFHILCCWFGLVLESRIVRWTFFYSFLAYNVYNVCHFILFRKLKKKNLKLSSWLSFC